MALRAEKDYLHGDIILGQWQRWKIEESPAAALYPVSALVAIKVLTGLTLAQLRSARDPGPPWFFWHSSLPESHAREFFVGFLLTLATIFLLALRNPNPRPDTALLTPEAGFPSPFPDALDCEP